MYYFRLLKQGLNKDDLIYAQFQENVWSHIFQKNPLISNTTMANELAAWLADYYTAGIEYEYDTRGNPELDATDIVYQENEFHDGMRVNIYRHTVNFKQAFSGRVTARRIGG